MRFRNNVASILIIRLNRERICSKECKGNNSYVSEYEVNVNEFVKCKWEVAKHDVCKYESQDVRLSML